MKKAKLTIGEQANLLRGALGVGRHNAQTVAELSAKTGIDKRQIWHVSNYLTEMLGETISSSKSKPVGIWLTEFPQEYDRTIAAHETEARTTLARVEIMKANREKKRGKK